MVADILIVEPVCKRGFCINDFFDLFRQRSALLIDRNTVDDFVFAALKIVLVTQCHQNIIECLLFKSKTNLPEAFVVPTAKSAIKVSSVSPERCETIEV